MPDIARGPHRPICDWERCARSPRDRKMGHESRSPTVLTQRGGEWPRRVAGAGAGANSERPAGPHTLNTGVPAHVPSGEGRGQSTSVSVVAMDGTGPTGSVQKAPATASPRSRKASRLPMDDGIAKHS